jgi:hypothetical protein
LSYETPDGAWFRLYRTPYAGTARHTIAGWEVEDLKAEVAKLKARGVAFEEDRSKQFQTVDGIATTQSGRGWPASRTARATFSAWPRQMRPPAPPDGETCLADEVSRNGANVP